MVFYRFRRFFLIFVVLFVILFTFSSKCFATTVVFNAEQELIDLQKQYQDDFILLCLYPYLENSQAWTDTLKPFFDTIHENAYDIYITKSASAGTAGTSLYYVRAYNFRQLLGQSTLTYTSQTYVNLSQTIVSSLYDVVRYQINYNANNNTFTLSSTTQTNYSIPSVLSAYRSDLWFHFMEVVYGGNEHLGDLLDDIISYLDRIDASTSYSATELGAIYTTLTNIATSVSYLAQNYQDYSSVLSTMSTRLSTIASRISTTNDRLNIANGHLQDISTYVNTLNDKVQAIENFLENSNFSTNTITQNFPTNNFITSPTDNIVADIFDTIEDAFTNENAPDIVIPMPFMDNNITIPSNYTETFFPSWVKTFIQAFYWFLIARWIILSIVFLVNRLRTLDFIEQTDNGAPKTELL